MSETVKKLTSKHCPPHKGVSEAENRLAMWPSYYQDHRGGVGETMAREVEGETVAQEEEGRRKGKGKGGDTTGRVQKGKGDKRKGK